MGFNKKLLDHFSEILRCNQYPKRYLGDIAKIYAFLHRVTLSAYYINWGHNIEFQRTEGRSIVICLNSASIQRSGSWLIPDMRGEKEGSRWGVQGHHKNSRESEHRQFEIASSFCSVLLLKAAPQMRGPRCVNGVSGGGRREWVISICQICSRSAFLKFRTLLLNFKGN